MRNARQSLVALAVLGVCTTGQSARAEELKTTQDFLNYWSTYYQTHEPESSVAGEVQEEEGDGFFPFNRFKDFVGRRFPDLSLTGGNMPAGVRWQAYQELKQMEATQGRSGETWFSIGPANLTGRCLAIAIHPTNPDIVYAGFASGGLWKTVDGGTTWVPMTDDLPTLSVSGIAIDSGNPNRLWITTGESFGNIDAVHGAGVFVSTDAGVTWGTTGLTYNLSQGVDFNCIRYNANSGVLMVGGSHLWRSTDQGVSFSEVVNALDWWDIEMKRGSTTTWFACGSPPGANAGFYISTDDGATWTMTSEEMVGIPVTCRFCLTNADPNTIYFSANNGGTTMRIWKSTDGGFGWTQVFTGSHYGNQGWYDFSLDMSQTNTTTLFSGGVEFYRSTNGGTTFSNWSGAIHVDHHATAWAPSDDNIFWVGSDGGVWKSTNAGNSFTGKNAGLVTTQFYAMGSSKALPTRALGGLQDNGTWQYDNSLTWKNNLGGDGFQCEADPIQANTMYGEIYNGQHYRTIDNVNWFSKNSGIGNSGPWETPTWLDLADHNWIWTSHNTTMYRSTNQANNWAAVAGYTATGESRAISQSPSNTNIMADAHAGKIYFSTDHGVTWTNRVTGLNSGNTISDVTWDPSDENTLYATCATYSTTINQIYKTTDQGLNWFAIDAGLPDEPLNAVEVSEAHPSWVFIASDLGMYVSFDGGTNWAPFNNGLPHVVCSDIRINDANNFVRISTHGRGFWEVDISNLGTTAVGETLPIRPSMLKVFGNPASEKTILRYGLRSAGNFTLGIYDANGRKVLPVKDGYMIATVENEEVTVSSLPAGVYFARLDAAGTSVTQKLVIQH